MDLLVVLLVFCNNWINFVPEDIAVNLMYQIRVSSEPNLVHKISHPTLRPVTAVLKVFQLMLLCQNFSYRIENDDKNLNYNHVPYLCVNRWQHSVSNHVCTTRWAVLKDLYLFGEIITVRHKHGPLFDISKQFSSQTSVSSFSQCLVCVFSDSVFTACRTVQYSQIPQASPSDWIHC